MNVSCCVCVAFCVCMYVSGGVLVNDIDDGVGVVCRVCVSALGILGGA